MSVSILPSTRNGLSSGLLTLFVSAFVLTDASNLRAQASDASTELLGQLKAERQAVFATATQGTGTATVRESHDTSGFGGSTLLRGPMRVEFRFQNRKSICQQYNVSNVLAQSVLLLDDRRTAYVLGGTPGYGRSEVMISRPETSQPRQDERLQQWSYIGIAKLPWVGTDVSEDKAFDNVLRMPGSRIEQLADNKVRLTASANFVYGTGETESASESVDATFDLLVGGMVVDYQTVMTKKPRNGLAVRIQRNEHTEWALQNGTPIPKSRSVTAEQVRGGKTEVAGKSEITFDRFELHPVPDADFNVQALSIPSDTVVVDDVLKLQYRYGTGMDVSTSSLPAEQPPLPKSADEATAATVPQVAGPNAERRRNVWLWTALLAGIAAVFVLLSIKRKKLV